MTYDLRLTTYDSYIGRAYIGVVLTVNFYGFSCC